MRSLFTFPLPVPTGTYREKLLVFIWASLREIHFSPTILIDIKLQNQPLSSHRTQTSLCAFSVWAFVCSCSSASSLQLWQPHQTVSQPLWTLLTRTWSQTCVISVRLTDLRAFLCDLLSLFVSVHHIVDFIQPFVWQLVDLQSFHSYKQLDCCIFCASPVCRIIVLHLFDLYSSTCKLLSTVVRFVISSTTHPTERKAQGYKVHHPISVQPFEVE